MTETAATMAENTEPTDILSWIDVGSISAERDEKLNEYFYDNGVTKSVLGSPSTFLVLGRKGAGKTAVFRHLAENSTKFLDASEMLVPLSFEDYSWNVHSLLRKSETSESLAYKQSWRFVLYVEALKAFASRCEQDGKKEPKELRKAMKLLSKLFDHPLPTVNQLIGRKLLALSKIKLPSAGMDGLGAEDPSLGIDAGEVAFAEVEADAGLQSQLSQNIDNLITYLEGALAACSSLGVRVFLCFDRVDEAWDDVSVETSSRVIAGLVAAADAVSSVHKQYLRPVIFLREDIFETLSINDANKLREDCGALLSWDRDSIFKVVNARMAYFARQAGCEIPEDFDLLFDKKEMRQRARPSSYLLKRSMMRPRDMICFLKRTIQAAKESRDDPFGEPESAPTTQLSTESIYDAESGYSDWLHKEIMDEWSAQFPKIKGLLDIIQNHGLTNISFEDLDNGISQAEPESTRADRLRLMTFMFDNSLIGFKVGSSTQWRFKCFYPSQGFVETEQYHVHEGLIRALNLKETREKDSSD